ncbi:hypothetical protein [Nocardioides convexus]|uniref:hypothetical protein n=1 Tax=Nocardioides convexus TaxID=2712224 RepID=UPI002418A363|nr:hypothetical protein [Nocardioides convexus]
MTVIPGDRLAALEPACALDDALALFDSLPAVRAEEVTGRWHGREAGDRAPDGRAAGGLGLVRQAVRLRRRGAPAALLHPGRIDRVGGPAADPVRDRGPDPRGCGRTGPRGDGRGAAGAAHPQAAGAAAQRGVPRGGDRGDEPTTTCRSSTCSGESTSARCWAAWTCAARRRTSSCWSATDPPRPQAGG